MDSLLPEVEQHYKESGCQIVRDPDQYSTDLKKCLNYIVDQAVSITGRKTTKNGVSSSPIDQRLDIVIMGSLGGRADQAFSQLHQLYVSSQEISKSQGDVYLVTSESIIFLLEIDLNSIHSPVGPGFLTKYVGIIPIGRPSVITTRGLEYDVKDWSTEFGTRVSTSNHIVEDDVEVKTTERVLFTVGIAQSDER